MMVVRKNSCRRWLKREQGNSAVCHFTHTQTHTFDPFVKLWIMQPSHASHYVNHDDDDQTVMVIVRFYSSKRNEWAPAKYFTLMDTMREA